jgi:hypothetical protein
LQYWAFHADWADTANATFTKVGTVPTASFDSNLCGYQRSCIPQPGNPPRKLDALSDRLMYRLQYRNFGTHESWVVNHTVDVTGGDRAGIRWYELRKTGGGPLSIHQQATFSPDSNHRWMASAAMDGAGNIAVAYNVSSSTINPSIRFTGRNAGDTLGELTLGETDMMVGSGRQTHSSSRWGDYSMLAVDPVDNCTFWATLEYYASTISSAGWRTRVAAFKLPGCGGTPPPDPTVPAAPVLSAQAAGNAIRLTWTNVANETSYEVYRNGALLATLAADKTTYNDRSAAKGVSYAYFVKACNAQGCSIASNTVNAER